MAALVCPAACLHALLLVSAAAASAGEVSIQTVSGETASKAGFRSLSDGQIRFEDGGTLRVDDVRLIRFAEPANRSSTAPSPPLVHLSGGGQLPVRDASLVDDACEATLVDGRKATLPLESVAAVQWSPSSDAVWRDSLSSPSEEHDRVVLKAQPQATAIRAFIEKVDAADIEFDWERQTRTVPKTQVIGVVFARPERPAVANIRVSSRSGALLPVTRLDWSDDTKFLRCSLSQGGTIDLPASELAAIHINSSRVRPLSGMTPVRVTERPIAALPRSWKADLNVRGESLRAGQQTYEQGIGVQAGTSLSWELDGSAEQFAAVVAVDSPMGITGDCEFVVVADGQELVRQRVKSGDEPVPLRVALGGSRQLELRVDYGSNLDFGDHANWCDAHLVIAAAGQSVHDK